MPKIKVLTDNGIEMESINVSAFNFTNPLGRAAIIEAIEDAVIEAEDYHEQLGDSVGNYGSGGYEEPMK